MTDHELMMSRLHEVQAGGAYEWRDGHFVRLEGPPLPGEEPAAVAQKADGEAGAVVGATSGEPPSSPEATAGSVRAKAGK
jgi:hypothetical protein